ncbi:melanization protease 1-like [Aricia agestis]|uniref:melanization protease 1-like n=1 Tax=Aricia agestis TaxID=91739 RepID=UPI001C208EA7|nr:melanization protease 1-like [Aricia agestis]
MGYLSCEGAIFAMKRRRPETEKLIQNSICGYENYKGKIIEKVCCSVFTDMRLDLLPRECGRRYINSVGRGRMTSQYEFPWMALIAYKTDRGISFGCSGTIINIYYLLTAAHCVVWTKSIAGVRVGEHDITRQYDCIWDDSDYNCESHIQDIPVAERVIHKGYSYSTSPVRHDIALLRVADRIQYNYRNVGPICLPVARELRDNGLWGRRGLVAGWGETETGRSTNVLLKVSLPVLTERQCQNKYGRNRYTGRKQLVENKICAGETHVDSCRGDSGGPLMAEDEHMGEYKFVQYGIVSEGPKICGSAQPGLYTDVAKYIDWILDNIKLH